ncbi:unnamed protein product [Linum trigynum]|uniref:Uncharacterized protein n=1 Tax=Linum trigynum TaxID=586398 RepID=A0AAV2D5N1_9ROSI
MLFLVPIREMARIQSKPLMRQGSLAGSCLRRWRRDESAGSRELLATVATGWKRRERGAACYNKDWRWRCDGDWGWRCHREAPMPGQEVLTADSTIGLFYFFLW